MWSVIYISVIVFSCALSYIFTLLARKFAIKINFVDRPGSHKGHVQSVPLLGGAAIFISLVVTVFLGILFSMMAMKGGPFSNLLPDGIRIFLPGIPKVMNKLLAIFGGALIIFILGIIDDRKSLGALAKLLVQILAGSIVFLLGLRITLFTSNYIISYFLTVFWIVLVTNAFNLLDNMDGLASGVACIAGMIFLMLSAVNRSLISDSNSLLKIGTVKPISLRNSGLLKFSRNF